MSSKSVPRRSLEGPHLCTQFGYSEGPKEAHFSRPHQRRLHGTGIAECYSISGCMRTAYSVLGMQVHFHADTSVG